MKLSLYIDIHRIEFIVTYQCSGHCAHCSIGDQLNQLGPYKAVDPEMAAQAVRELAERYPVTSVMTFGGEPLLYPDSVLAIHAAARDAGIDGRQLITNGYFSKRAERTAQVAHGLAEAGVNNVLLSVDAFHQETIPLKVVREFASSVVAAGVSIRLHPAWVVTAANENPYNTRTREILAELSDLGLSVTHGNDIFLSGNAAKNLAQYYPAPSLDLSARCGSMPYTEPLTSVTSLTIVPGGDVMVCSFVIGNLYREPLDDILERYDPYKHDQMLAVLEGGAAGLLEYARGVGLDVDAMQCYSMCDICRTLANIEAKEMDVEEYTE